MSMQTFRATSVQEAIRMAKAAFGPDALIVDVRRVGATGADVGREGYIEITASAGDLPVDSAAPGNDRQLPSIEELAARTRGRGAPLYDRQTATSDAGDFARLRQFGISPALARSLAAASDLGSGRARRAAIAETLQRALPMRDLRWGTRGQIIATLVGPSGVGKTTTIAKFAAAFSAGQRSRVALITTDTYRVGAIAQLRTFAEILQLPFYTVYAREELEQALGELTEVDLILIDTPGCNPYDAAMLKELRNLIGSRSPIACYLTLAVTADFEETISGAERFGLFNPTGVIFTKLDETRRAASLIGLAERLNLPVSYVCNGPLVPEDIALATPGLLAELVLDALETPAPVRL